MGGAEGKLLKLVEGEVERLWLPLPPLALLRGMEEESDSDLPCVPLLARGKREIAGSLLSRPGFEFDKASGRDCGGGVSPYGLEPVLPDPEGEEPGPGLEVGGNCYPVVG